MAAEQPQQNMEDILSSIRTTMEEEAARTGPLDGDDDGDVLVLENELSDEEILALAETEMLDGEAVSAGTAGEGLIDLAAFTNSGTMKASAVSEPVPGDDVLGINLPSGEEAATDMASAEAVESVVMPAEEGAAEDDAFDKLMNELKQDKETSHAQRVEDLLADAAPDTSAVLAADAMGEVADVVPEAVASLASAVGSPAPRRVELPAMTGATGGLQVALPAEVLAEALRPLISQWLSENLPGVVERLVQREISKLTQQ